MNTTSISLLERLAHSPTNADWERLLAIYRPLIEGQIRRYRELFDQCDDVIQEVMIILMRELPTFHRRGPGAFRAWLREIVVNQLRRFSRQAKHAPIPAGTRENLIERIEQLADPHSDAARKWDAEHGRHVLAPNGFLGSFRSVWDLAL